MMVSMVRKILAWISVDNNYCSSFMSHEISAMWYIIKLLSYDKTIDDAGSNTPYFYVFLWWYWSMTEEVRIFTMQSIISWAGDPDHILMAYW